MTTRPETPLLLEVVASIGFPESKEFTRTCLTLVVAGELLDSVAIFIMGNLEGAEIAWGRCFKLPIEYILNDDEVLILPVEEFGREIGET